MRAFHLHHGLHTREDSNLHPISFKKYQPSSPPAPEETRWGTGEIGVNDLNANPSSQGRTGTRVAPASRGRLHGTIDRRRDSNPLFQWERSIRSLHHQRFFMPICRRARSFQGNRRTGSPKRGRFVNSEVPHAHHHLGQEAAEKRQGKLQKRILSRRSGKYRAAVANPFGSPRHRYPAFASFPPAGPALASPSVQHHARAPGSGSPVPTFAGLVSFMTAVLENLKNKTLRSGQAREGPLCRTCRHAYAVPLP